MPRTRRSFCEVTVSGLFGALAGANCQLTEPGVSDHETASPDLGATLPEPSATDSSGATSADDDTTSTATTADSSDPGESSDSMTSSSGGDACKPSIEQTPGPYPQPGLERDNLDLFGHDGVPFELTGRVIDTNCDPVANAIVLLWHAMPSPPGVKPNSVEPDPEYRPAVYDHDNMGGETTPDGLEIPTGQQMYYGWVRTDNAGRYHFRTLRPGWYLNGSAYRTSHLHVRVFIDDAIVATTQLYFSDDTFNETDAIFVACANQGECVMPIDGDGNGTFDLVVSM